MSMNKLTQCSLFFGWT